MSEIKSYKIVWDLRDFAKLSLEEKYAHLAALPRTDPTFFHKSRLLTAEAGLDVNRIGQA